MFVSVEEIQKGVNNFVEKELAPKAGDKKKFLVYLALPLIKANVKSYIDTFYSEPFTKILFDENKKVDIDSLYDMAKSAMAKTGSVTVFGIIFNETDVMKLYSYIKESL